MPNSITKLETTLIVLLKLVINNKITIDDTCPIAIALHQQGIYSVDDVQEYDFYFRFYNIQGEGYGYWNNSR